MRSRRALRAIAALAAGCVAAWLIIAIATSAIAADFFAFLAKLNQLGSGITDEVDYARRFAAYQTAQQAVGAAPWAAFAACLCLVLLVALVSRRPPTRSRPPEPTAGGAPAESAP